MYVCMYVYIIYKSIYMKSLIKKSMRRAVQKVKIIMDNNLAGSGFTPSSTGFIPVSF